jgi:hypothetical protein
MSDYVPDPIELMEMRADRMMERYFSDDKPGMFLCGACGRWVHESEGMISATVDPSSPPICWACVEESQ